MLVRSLACLLCVLLSTAPTVEAGFTDVTEQAGIDYLQWNALPGPLETKRITGGAAAGDVDGDGFPDLFVTRLDGPDILFRNDGHGAFRNISDAAGFQASLPTNGAAFGDIDNDGDLDLYLTTVGDQRYYLYMNDGTGRFSEQGLSRNAAIATGDKHLGMSVALGDYDRDGYLDVHTTEWGNQTFDPSDLTLRSHARVLRNLGRASPGHFEDATLATGIFLDNHVGFGARNTAEGLWRFTSTFADFDRDGYADLAIAGDFHTSELYWNNGDGTFNVAPGPFNLNSSGIGTDENGMGSAIADFNGDGLLDWFVTAINDPADPCGTNRCNWNASGNRLYLNNGDRTFTDVTDLAGVRDGGWGWGTTFFDYDNDGDLDLVMTNGMISPSEFAKPFSDDPIRLWRNDGTGRFTEVAQEEGLNDTGAGKGLLTFDYDLDGDLDLFIVNNAGHPKLYRNDVENGNAHLMVHMEGTRSNRDGIGAFVTLIADPGADPQTRYVTGGDTTYLSQSDLTVHFGLGPRASSIYQLIIDWPSGIEQVFSNVPINTTLRAIEPVPEPTSLVLAILAASCLLGQLACLRKRLLRQSRLATWSNGPDRRLRSPLLPRPVTVLASESGSFFGRPAFEPTHTSNSKNVPDPFGCPWNAVHPVRGYPRPQAALDSTRWTR